MSPPSTASLSPGCSNYSPATGPRARPPSSLAHGVTWRYRGEMYSIGIGRTHTGTRVIVLSQDLDIRVIDAATGELLRELALDTSKRYQGTGRPPGPTR